MTGNRKKEPVFTAGVTYEEHQKRARETYEDIVRPQIEARKKSKEKKAQPLTDAQKAHLSCNSPI